MSRRFYKFYADTGPNPYQLERTLSVLNTGAGLNFIRHNALPPGSDDRVRAGAIFRVCDANLNPIDTAGMTSFVVRVGTEVSKVTFIVCSSLAVPMTLGCD